MTWARHSSPTEEQGLLAGIRAEEHAHMSVQNGRAARTVAGHASDALECAELLAMLGLEAAEGRRAAHAG